MIPYDLSISQIVLAIIIVTIGAITQGSVGFGFAMVVAPLLILINDYFVPGPVIVVAFFTAFFISFRDGNKATFDSIKFAIAGRIVGNLIGAALVAYLARDKFTIFFGILVLIAVLISISGFHIKLNKKNLVLGGFFSGFMGTTVSISGPPIALLFQNEKGQEFRNIMALFFMIGILLSIPSLAILGAFGWPEFILGLLLVPGCFVGVILSNMFAKKIDKHSIQPYVLGLSSISGILAILKVILF